MLVHKLDGLDLEARSTNITKADALDVGARDDGIREEQRANQTVQSLNKGVMSPHS
jgi:hypothetical protein